MRGKIVLLLIGSMVVSFVVGLVYVRNLAFVDGAGVLYQSFSALWRSWPVFFGLGMGLALFFALWLIWGLEAAYDIDRDRLKRDMAEELARARTELTTREKELDEQRNALWRAESLHAKNERALTAQREETERLQQKARSEIAESAQIKHMSGGYRERYRRKLAKLNRH